MKILLADDHPVVRRGLKQILLEEFADAVFGEAQNGPEATAMANSGQWDVIVLDLAMPGGNGLEALEQIKQDHSTLPVLILSNYPEEQYAVMVIRAGAAGYLNKESATEELVVAIRQTLLGGIYISPSLATELVFHTRNGDEEPACADLSDPEYRVLCSIASGREGRNTSTELFLSAQAISTCRTRILEKMNMTTNAELTQYAFKTALI